MKQPIIGTFLLSCLFIIGVSLILPMSLQSEVMLLRVLIMLFCVAYLLELSDDKPIAKEGDSLSESLKEEKRDFTNRQVYKMINKEIESLEYCLNVGIFTNTESKVFTSRIATLEKELSQIKL